MSLPIFQNDDRDFSMMQTKWASQLNPVLELPWSTGVLLKNVVLASGSNTINHKLARNLQGWVPVRFHGGFAQIYDTQDTNTMPSLTLMLTASAGVTVDLLVF
jgi:hypothetical protein